MKQLSLKGNYCGEATQIRIEVDSGVDSNVVMVCVHGLYGEAGDVGSKSVQLGRALRHVVRGVVYITTSRHWELYGKTDNFAEPFAQKTFAEEQQDVRDAINMAIEDSLSLFGLDSGAIALWVVGNSMGGVARGDHSLLISRDYENSLMRFWHHTEFG